MPFIYDKTTKQITENPNVIVIPDSVVYEFTEKYGEKLDQNFGRFDVDEETGGLVYSENMHYVLVSKRDSTVWTISNTPEESDNFTTITVGVEKIREMESLRMKPNTWVICTVNGFDVITTEPGYIYDGVLKEIVEIKVPFNPPVLTIDGLCDDVMYNGFIYNNTKMGGDFLLPFRTEDQQYFTNLNFMSPETRTMKLYNDINTLRDNGDFVTMTNIDNALLQSIISTATFMRSHVKEVATKYYNDYINIPIDNVTEIKNRAEKKTYVLSIIKDLNIMYKL